MFAGEPVRRQAQFFEHAQGKRMHVSSRHGAGGKCLPLSIAVNSTSAIWLRSRVAGAENQNALGHDCHTRAPAVAGGCAESRSRQARRH